MDTWLMPSENAEVVRRAHQALNSGDMDALVALCDKDFRLDMSDRIFNPAVYDGHDGIRQFYAEVRDVWEIYVWVPEQLIEAGSDVVALLRSTGRGRESGVEVERPVPTVGAQVQPCDGPAGACIETSHEEGGSWWRCSHSQDEAGACNVGCRISAQSECPVDHDGALLPLKKVRRMKVPMARYGLY